MKLSFHHHASGYRLDNASRLLSGDLRFDKDHSLTFALFVPQPMIPLTVHRGCDLRASVCRGLHLQLPSRLG